MKKTSYPKQDIRVLLLEGKPYWDGKFLMRTLAADPVVALDSVVRMAEGRFLRRSLNYASPAAAADPAADSSSAENGSGLDVSRDERWKVIGNPADVVGGISEQFRALDGTDPIIALHRLGENLVIYSENTVALAQFVGDPEVFVFRKATTGVGPLGPKAVAIFADYHEFVGNDSMYRFDGSTSMRVNRHVWREILRTQDPARAFRIYDGASEVHRMVVARQVVKQYAG